MPTSNAEELRLFFKCTVIGRGVFGPCACWTPEHLTVNVSNNYPEISPNEGFKQRKSEHIV